MPWDTFVSDPRHTPLRTRPGDTMPASFPARSAVRVGHPAARVIMTAYRPETAAQSPPYEPPEAS